MNHIGQAQGFFSTDAAAWESITTAVQIGLQPTTLAQRVVSLAVNRLEVYGLGIFKSLGKGFEEACLYASKEASKLTEGSLFARAVAVITTMGAVSLIAWKAYTLVSNPLLTGTILAVHTFAMINLTCSNLTYSEQRGVEGEGLSLHDVLTETLAKLEKGASDLYTNARNFWEGRDVSQSLPESRGSENGSDEEFVHVGNVLYEDVERPDVHVQREEYPVRIKRPTSDNTQDTAYIADADKYATAAFALSTIATTFFAGPVFGSMIGYSVSALVKTVAMRYLAPSESAPSELEGLEFTSLYRQDSRFTNVNKSDLRSPGWENSNDGNRARFDQDKYNGHPAIVMPSDNATTSFVAPMMLPDNDDSVTGRLREYNVTLLREDTFGRMYSSNVDGAQYLEIYNEGRGVWEWFKGKEPPRK